LFAKLGEKLNPPGSDSKNQSAGKKLILNNQLLGIKNKSIKNASNKKLKREPHQRTENKLSIPP
jgi:hypothetical protein